MPEWALARSPGCFELSSGIPAQLQNADTTVNAHGRRLLQMCEDTASVLCTGKTALNVPAQPSFKACSNTQPSRLDHVIVDAELFHAIQSCTVGPVNPKPAASSTQHSARLLGQQGFAGNGPALPFSAGQWLSILVLTSGVLLCARSLAGLSAARLALLRRGFWADRTKPSCATVEPVIASSRSKSSLSSSKATLVNSGSRHVFHTRCFPCRCSIFQHGIASLPT
ncbi:TPA: hypothetical protein ACH3X3_000750 [Trebouxia sp. C0006]